SSSKLLSSGAEVSLFGLTANILALLLKLLPATVLLVEMVTFTFGVVARASALSWLLAKGLLAVEFGDSSSISSKYSTKKPFSERFLTNSTSLPKQNSLEAPAAQVGCCQGVLQ